MDYFVGIDVGGTNIKAVLLDGNKKQLRALAMPTQVKKGKAKAAKNILEAASLVSEGKKISAIGLGLAGLVDAERGMLVSAPNLRALEKVKLKAIIKKKFRVPVIVENDANAAAYAESRIGAGTKCENLVLLTLGTGIGSGIIINRKLFVGATHSAAEIGHAIIDAHGYKCNCGNFGCLEAMANARFIERKAKELARKHKTTLKKFDPLSVQIAAQKGDFVARETYRQLAENLGIGLANICNFLNPDIIVLAGGIAKAKIIYPIAIKKMRQCAFRQSTEHVKVCQTRIGYFAGAVGAALLAMEK